MEKEDGRNIDDVVGWLKASSVQSISARHFSMHAQRGYQFGLNALPHFRLS